MSAAPESQPLASNAADGGQQGSSSLKFLLGGGALLALGMLLGGGVVLVARPSDETAVLASAAVESPTDPRSGVLACGAPGSHEWQAISSIDPVAKVAIARGLTFLQRERKSCEGGAFPPLPFSAQDFEKGANHSHHVHVHHKFASTCIGETYKLHYYVGPAESSDTTFILEVYQDVAAKTWKLLRASPNPCEIGIGGATAYPETLSPTEKLAKEASNFAAVELAYQMKKASCLGENSSLKVDQVRQARSQVSAGLQIEMVLLLSIKGEDGSVSDPKAAELIVMERCDVLARGRCLKELELPAAEGSACSVLRDPQEPVMRRLLGFGALGRQGHVRPDATERLVAKREQLAPRRLGESSSASRPSMMDRRIKKGAIPSSLDPRKSECYKKIPVYDQGDCGSCYAQAVAQMIGIRKCLLDKGKAGIVTGSASSALRRRRSSSSQRRRRGGSSRRRRRGRRLVSKAGLGRTVAEGRKGAAASRGDSGRRRRRRKCADSKSWTDQYGDGCAWYADNDPGCEEYDDEGQLTHCQKTCNTCSIAINPWSSALYKYMPSVSDLAPCAKDGSGGTSGCDGGNTQMIWDEWMRHLKRDLWVMGEKCQPYDLKCWEIEPGAVVNPLSGGSCSLYTDYQLFHRPCSCIPDQHKPQEYMCPTGKPKKSCGHPVPPAMFTVSNGEQGLSTKQAMENMQRHIHEFGAIYVSFDTTSAFMEWDWKKKPVYTGGGRPMGGHAVMAVGWGSQGNTPYWIIRNSWGDAWADKGYCKFKRGVNLDNIESSESTAAMPTEDYQDWSAPYCDITKSLLSHSTSKTKIYAYDMKISIVCNKAAKLEVWISDRMENRDDEAMGITEKATAKARKPVEITVDLICGDFGLKSGETWIDIESTDSSGNQGTTTHYLAIPVLEGMTKRESC